MKTSVITTLGLLVTFCLPIYAERPVMEGTPSGQILATGAKRVIMMNPKGEVVWQHKGDNVSDCWMQKNGRVLIADNRIKEIDVETGKVTFMYAPKVAKGGGTYGCQPLENGNILVGENSTGKIYEMQRDGKVVFELQLPLYQAGSHHNLRMVRKLKNGNYLVCHSGKHTVREYTPEGKIVFEVKVGNLAFSASRLTNGNTLVGHIDQITEFSPTGEVVWKFANTDIPGLTLGPLCGVHVLDNGNLAVGVYAAYKGGGEAGLFEITREKKLVWCYSNPKSDRSMMSIQMLDSDGKPLPGDIVR
ncbi:MAG: hypothetical protein H7A51_10650 [Akkermansiaceae bacterium]|nr:hypothetical protein [Akkermansiaceae bacterium]